MSDSADDILETDTKSSLSTTLYDREDMFATASKAVLEGKDKTGQKFNSSTGDRGCEVAMEADHLRDRAVAWTSVEDINVFVGQTSGKKICNAFDDIDNERDFLLEVAGGEDGNEPHCPELNSRDEHRS